MDKFISILFELRPQQRSELFYGYIAQLVEHQSDTLVVSGSSPGIPTNRDVSAQSYTLSKP